MSRPEKPIDWDRVERLLMADCTGVEIAPHFNMHPHTFYDRVQEKYNMRFTDYCAEKKSHGDSLIKEAQFEEAVARNNTMMVWLGKQRLGQKENHDQAAPNNDQMLGDILAEVKSMKNLTEIAQTEQTSPDNVNAFKDILDSIKQTKEQPVAPIPKTDPIDTAGDAQV